MKTKRGTLREDNCPIENPESSSQSGLFFSCKWSSSFYILGGRFSASGAALDPEALHPTPWKWAGAGGASCQSNQDIDPGWLPLHLPCSFLISSSRRRWWILQLFCKALISTALCCLWRSTLAWINSLNAHDRFYSIDFIISIQSAEDRSTLKDRKESL